MYRLDVPAGSDLRLFASAGPSTQVRRWDVRMFAADAPARSWPPRLTYGSEIGGADGDQRVEIPPQDVDCWLEVGASRRIGGFWEPDQWQVTSDTLALLELDFDGPAAPASGDSSIQLSFHFCAARPPSQGVFARDLRAGPSGADPDSAAAASAERQVADLLAEDRSEDDGMREHADKASDPARWAARRDALAGD